MVAVRLHVWVIDCYFTSTDHVVEIFDHLAEANKYAQGQRVLGNKVYLWDAMLPPELNEGPFPNGRFSFAPPRKGKTG